MNVKLRSAAFSAVACFVLGGLLAGCGSGGGSSTGDTGGTSGTSSTSGGSLQPGDQTPDPNKIKIGLVASINGDLKPWGMDSQNGALLAVDEINKAGGIGGKEVQLLIEDSNSTPEQGKTAAERLISKGCVAVVGEVASGITAQIALAAQEKKIPVVAVGATKTELPGIGEHVFRVCYTDDLQGPVMATFAYEELGLRNVAIVTDNKQPYSTYLSKTFRDSFEKQGGKIVDEQFYESKQTQFGPLLTNLKAKNPDGLFLSGYFTEVGPIVRQAAEAGLNAKFLGGDGWDSAEILTSGGDAILGGFFCNHYNNQEDRPEVKTFLEKWQAAFGGVPGTTMGALGYDAVGVALDALKRASDVNSAESVLAAISETEGFAGVSGVITLKGSGGNPDKRALVVKLAKEGQVYEKAYEVSEVKR
ncbi:MAG: ABC transporter substrate-binding protein [Methanoregulaceae archaeon]|nr:ABC transporter substrate-binding protein [Methanoregulaceae archaeon]